jgi:8-amino-7-oxononanoate synthase
MDVLQQTTRTAIYTTALPAALAETTRHALRILRADDWRRERLQTLTAKLRSGLQAQGWTLMDSATPIQPIHMGSSERALALSAALVERGFWVGAIRPPTVPAGTARLRLTLSASHDDAALASLLSAMAELAPEFATEMTT